MEMINDLILISDQMPEKGRNIIGYDEEGEKHYCYRNKCKCCDDWRCSITGYGLLINIVKWQYE